MAVSTGITLIYVPCGSVDEASKLAGTLLEERLIACANVHETRSIYRWKGEIANETEYVLTCKTTPSRAEEAARRIEALHSYKVPCVLRMQPAQANAAYAAWAEEEVGKLEG